MVHMTLADRWSLINAYEPLLFAVQRRSICEVGLGFQTQSSQTGSDDADDGDMSILIRGAIRLEVGEVVHAALLERVGSHALRCLKQALYPGILLPEG